MKQKFYMLFAAILVSCMAALGQTPNSNGSRNMQKAGEEAFIQLHIDKLKADITLTINQETEIRELLKTFYKDREQADKKADKNQKLNDKKLSYEVYKAALYNILTEEQCIEIQQKVELRKDTGTQTDAESAN